MHTFVIFCILHEAWALCPLCNRKQVCHCLALHHRMLGYCFYNCLIVGGDLKCKWSCLEVRSMLLLGSIDIFSITLWWVVHGTQWARGQRYKGLSGNSYSSLLSANSCSETRFQTPRIGATKDVGVSIIEWKLNTMIYSTIYFYTNSKFLQILWDNRYSS